MFGKKRVHLCDILLLRTRDYYLIFNELFDIIYLICKRKYCGQKRIYEYIPTYVYV